MFGRKTQLSPDDSVESGDDTAETPAHEPSTFRGRLHSTVRFVLVGGDIAFGFVASTQPSKLTAIMQEDEATVRRIGARDLASGLALWGMKESPWPLLMSIRTNLFEAIGWLRTKPRLAVVPFAWVALAVLALFTRPSKKKS